MKTIAATLSMALCAGAVHAQPVSCDLAGPPIASFGANHAWRVDSSVIYRAAMLKVDADGAPNSYRVDGNGLSYTCDGVAAVKNGVRQTSKNAPHTWQAACNTAWTAARVSGDYSGVAIFGFLKDSHGAPIVQGVGDPLPGRAFITTTYVELLAASKGTQRRFIDAVEIPYVVLPEQFRARQGVARGALAAVYRPKTETIAFAVFGDTGGALDEASVKLHQDLGGQPLVQVHNVTRAKENIDDEVVVAIFPTDVSDPMEDAAAWRSDIASKGAAALNRWGGADRLKACAK